MMQGATNFLAWLRANPAATILFVYALTGVLNACFKPRTPEQYAAMPRVLAGIMKFVAGAGLDPVKIVEALVSILKLPAPGDGSPKNPKDGG